MLIRLIKLEKVNDCYWKFTDEVNFELDLQR